ncbi:polyhomeotic-like protein 2b [Aplochiton taeniatus]
MGHPTPASRWRGKRRYRRAIQKSRGSKVRRAEGTTMDSEPGPPPVSSSAGTTTTSITSTASPNNTGTTTTTSITSTASPNIAGTTTTSITSTASPSTASPTTASPSAASPSTASSSVVPSSIMSMTSSGTGTSTASGRQAGPQISIYSRISDRQTAQVIQQALHRQPNTAAQYLQQMYAAQQQHLMLHNAALQQHNLSTAQLQSLAAVQQASIAAGRQSSSQNGTSSQQTGSPQTTINLTTSPATAQLISRAQSVSSAPNTISQQAVLLGSPSSPTLTASQAQMYLRAQMAQQSNLVQVARSLGRAVPLSPQLIFTPTASVTAVQSESPTHSSSPSQNQVQNLAIRGQQGAPSSSSSSHSHTMQALSLKQSPVPIQPAALLKNPGQGPAGKAGSFHGSGEAGRKGDGAMATEVRAINMSRSVTSVSGQQLIASAYTQIHPHSLVQHHKQQQQQQQQQPFVLQQGQSSTQRPQGQLPQTASIQPHFHTPSQPSHHPVPVLPKPAPHQPSTPSQHATIFHSTISPHALPSGLSQASKAHPVQLTAINLQIQPTQASRLVQDHKDKPTSLVVRETCATPAVQPQLHQPQLHQPPHQKDTFSSLRELRVGGSTRGVRATPESPPPVMTSGNDNEAPPVTGSTAQNGESKPPQAIVKPQVLTHVIEGFVIQEGAEPFPVCLERLPILVDSPQKHDQQLSSDPDKTPGSNPANSDSEMEDLAQEDLKDQEEVPKLTCEYCGRVDFAYKFKRSKRFCSMVCAKRYNVGCTKRIGLFRPERTKPTNRFRKRSQGHSSVEAKKQKLSPSPQQTKGGSVSSPLPSQPSQGESSPCSDMSSYEEPLSPLSAASSGLPPPPHRESGRMSSDQEACSGGSRELSLLHQHFVPNDPTKWNVEEVYEFIRTLPGCQEIADEFRSQEIDGQAMLLLKEDHLMGTMNIKLGPALKIFARINMLKDS